MKKDTCNITFSSIPLWVYRDGDMENPIRGRSHANGDIVVGNFKMIKDKQGKYRGEKFQCSPQNYLEYSKQHVVKVRSGWDGFADETLYGPIAIVKSASPLANS